MKKTAIEKLNAKKDIKKVVMEKAFAGIQVGETMLVATPQIVAEYIRKIPYGKTKTIETMRKDLAKRQRCDGTCPMSTAIFVRIAAEAALEEMDAGKSVQEIIPFWRLVSGSDKVAKKLAIDPEWIDQQRELEAA